MARRGELVEVVLDAAAQAGAQMIQAAANQDAPTPAIETEANLKLSKTAYKVVDIGPKKQKWYYRFFETGVQPFEINMLTKRSTRSGGGGRPIHSSASGLAFDVDGKRIITPIVHRGSIPARPFLRPAMDSQKDRGHPASGQRDQEPRENSSMAELEEGLYRS